MNSLIEQNFDGRKVRTHIDDKGSPWFVAKDVMEILEIGYQAHALRKLDETEIKGVILQGDRGNREFAAVSESGLYTLIFESKKPQAKKFRTWVSSEVLPSIRKTGSYSVGIVTDDKDATELALDQAIKTHRLQKEMRVIQEAQRFEMLKQQLRIEMTEKDLVTTKSRIDNIVGTRIKPGGKPPEGTATLDQIRDRVFRGMSQENISKWLTSVGHPCTEFRYEVEPGAPETVVMCYREEGLYDRLVQLFNESVYIKDTPQWHKFKHPRLGNFAFIKAEVSPDVKSMIKSKQN
jgi:prophage antirepressor-like protein